MAVQPSERQIIDKVIARVFLLEKINSIKAGDSGIFSQGVKYMLLATLAFTFMQVLIKELSHFHVFQIIFFRSGITALLCISYMKAKNISLLGKEQTFLLLRAFCGISSMILFFLTIQRIPLGASVSLKYLSPIFAAVFTVVLIKEKVYYAQWLCFALALTGVIMLKGFDTRIDNVSFIMGILGAFFGGLVYILIRKIGKSEHPLVIINYFMSSAAILSGLGMINFWQAPTSQEWFLLISIGVIGYFGQIYMTQAFQAEAVSRVVPVKYMELIYSLIIGLIWFGESYKVISFIGIVLILIGMIMNLKVTASKKD